MAIRMSICDERSLQYTAAALYVSLSYHPCARPAYKSAQESTPPPTWSAASTFYASNSLSALRPLTLPPGSLSSFKATCLSCFDAPSPLSSLHASPTGKSDLQANYVKNYPTFLPAFRAFLKTAILPSLPLQPSSAILYQLHPCLRVVPPGHFSIAPHCDAQYGHNVFALNIYVRLCGYGSGGLVSESDCGLEDFEIIKEDGEIVGGARNEATDALRILRRGVARSEAAAS